MGIKVIDLVHLSIFFLIICCNGTDGRIIANSLAVKTIMTAYGDIYDCVDFYKQPAFDHPLLKNHTFDYQMAPTPVLDALSNDNEEGIKFVTTEIEGEGCPIGTVPIRRVAKSVLNGEKTSNGRVYTAIARKVTETTYIGAGGIMSLHNPKVTGQQYSAGRLKVENGPDSIEAGWRVDPKLYGDTQTRFYIRTDTGSAHCFNTLCPGFILTTPRYFLDTPLIKGEPEGAVVELVLAIVWESQNNWGLYMGNDLRRIGYWPHSIFTGLKKNTAFIQWGGVVYDPNPTRPTAQMGAGKPLHNDIRLDAHFRKTSEYVTRTQLVDAKDIQAVSDSYAYSSRQVNLRHDHEIQTLVTYGGPN